jgi:hypothetical protein
MLLLFGTSSTGITASGPKASGSVAELSLARRLMSPGMFGVFQGSDVTMADPAGTLGMRTEPMGFQLAGQDGVGVVGAQ